MMAMIVRFDEIEKQKNSFKMDVKCSTKKIVQNCAFIEIRLEFSNSFKKFDQYMKYILKNWFIFFLKLASQTTWKKIIMLTLVMDTHFFGILLIGKKRNL